MGRKEERLTGVKSWISTHVRAYRLSHGQEVKRRNERIEQGYSCERQAFAGREIEQASFGVGAEAAGVLALVGFLARFMSIFEAL